jgi:glucose-1-phosphate cytidylyltransferase
MKVVILAGGYGSRLSEETIIKPKPMIEIGGKPILWHIMKIYSFYGFNEFVICLGYKGHMIKEYFSNYFLHVSDVTVDLENNSMIFHRSIAEPWKITLVDTGSDTMTGGRILRAKKYIGDETFMLTYGDGLAQMDIGNLFHSHKESSKLATVTAVQARGRFGALTLNSSDTVVDFQEKPKGDGVWINGGYFVLEPQIFDYINGDETVWENEPLSRLVAEQELNAYRHEGFWMPMDTLRDKKELNDMWLKDTAPWRLW